MNFGFLTLSINPGNEEGEESEVGYWDSRRCLGEFMTIVRMKHDKQLICGEDGKIYKKLYEPVKDLLAEKEKKGVLIEEERKEFKVMLFSPDKEDPVEELSFDQIPEMTEEQNSILSKYFVNSDFRQSGLESMAVMRYLRYWPSLFGEYFIKSSKICISNDLVLMENWKILDLMILRKAFFRMHMTNLLPKTDC